MSRTAKHPVKTDDFARGKKKARRSDFAALDNSQVVVGIRDAGKDDLEN
ncbi:MAG TPA: hypothetical protein VN933_05595 [Candidatus Eremiobacteraceae bacterium]|jgi:hypothetical protein|nr:hypothetical protein [Candidatus Eremiobacteraceae bacterium]